MEIFPLNDLPEEILEKVFSFTSSYNDYINISLVCKKWNRIINGLQKLDNKSFNECFLNGNIYWKAIRNKTSANQIQLNLPSQRHSHSCCRVKDCLYVFGGLSDTCTSYNDLWMFDLNKRLWSRPITDGSYPSPKACASLISYKSSLVLFGGYSHPYQYPLNQQVNFFDELHVYCTKTCTWKSKLYSKEAPKLAGHTASIIDENKMILFGGCNGSLNNKTNNIYCLCLKNLEWSKKEIIGLKPESRYGHSQITIDDEHVLIVGGCGGPNHLYDDMWYLTLPKYSINGYWQKIIVRQTFNAPTQLHCISLVRCGDKLITFGRPKSNLNEINNKRKCTCLAANDEKKSNDESKKPCLSNQATCTNDEKKGSFAANVSINDNSKILNKSERIKTKRLEVLENIASKYIHAKMSNKLNLNNKTDNNNISNLFLFTRNKLNQCIVHSKLMQVFVLNIENLIVNEKNSKYLECNNQHLLEVTWLEPIFNYINAPPNTILYSLTIGINEILLFGGMEIDSTLSNIQYNGTNNNNNNNNNNDNDNEIVKHKVCNGLYIMKANNLF